VTEVYFVAHDRYFSSSTTRTLGRYPGELIHLKMDPTVSPHRSRAYPIAHAHLRLFMDELTRLVSLGVLEPQGRSECFGAVSWISDFWALNKALRRNVYPIPRIQDNLSRRSGYTLFSKLDISMQYYLYV
jgi:hypothetical protein